MKKKKHGFSILELGMVLLVVGMVIGGLVVGKSLIKSANTQKTISDFTKYTELAKTFKTKYYYFPGDMSNASSYWAGAKNGDGDGKIGCGSGALCQENTYPFQVLVAAGFASGTYAGTFSNSFYVLPGTTIPPVSISSANSSSGVTKLGMFYMNDTTALYRNVVAISSFNGSMLKSGVSPEDAKIIDSKVDDGFPSSGTVRGLDNSGSSITCVSGGTYPVTSSSNHCIVTNFLD